MTRKPVESQLLTSDSGNTCEIFPLPIDEVFLKELLTYIFEQCGESSSRVAHNIGSNYDNDLICG